MIQEDDYLQIQEVLIWTPYLGNVYLSFFDPSFLICNLKIVFVVQVNDRIMRRCMVRGSHMIKLAFSSEFHSSKGLSPLNHGELLSSHLSLVPVMAQVGPPEKTFFSFQHCSRIQPKNGLKSLSFQEWVKTTLKTLRIPQEKRPPPSSEVGLPHGLMLNIGGNRDATRGEENRRLTLPTMASVLLAPSLPEGSKLMFSHSDSVSCPAFPESKPWKRH